jgi:hypothetical protein
MNHELAKTLTTALVQFIDREQPKDKMGVSSIEAEEIERCFTEEKFERVEDWCAYRMLPELTEFEKCMLDFAKARDEYEFDSTKVVELNDKVIELTKSYAKKLLKIAGKEYVSGMPMPEDTILFQKGVEEGRRLEREEMRLKFYGNTEPVPTVNGPLCLRYGGICSNPMRDCINCNTVGPVKFNTNTSSGTSTLKAEG